MTRLLVDATRVHYHSRREHSCESLLALFVQRQLNWLLSSPLPPTLTQELSRVLMLPRRCLNHNLTVKLEILCAKVALECIPLENNASPEFGTQFGKQIAGESAKETCYREIAEAVVLEFSHMCHVTHIHLPPSFTVGTIVSVMAYYEHSLQRNGIHWLGTCLINRISELLELDNDAGNDADATHLTLLLASNGVVNFWDHESGSRLRSRNRLPELAG